MNTTRGAFEMVAAMVLSGTIGVFVIFSGRPVVDVVFWRCVFGALTLLAVCLAKGFLRRGVLSRGQMVLAIFGGVAIVTNWLLLFAAFPRASISIATAVYNTQPFMLVGLGTVFFAEKLTVAKLGWLALAFAGMLGIVSASSGADTFGSDYLTGIILALGAAFCYAVAAIITKKLQGVPPHLIALIQVTVGIAMLAPLADVTNLSLGINAWSMLITLGLFHTGLMYILLYGAIQKLPTSLTGALSFVYPIVAILVDLMVFGHRMQSMQAVGAAAILVAAAGMTLGWKLKWARRAARPL